MATVQEFRQALKAYASSNAPKVEPVKQNISAVDLGDRVVFYDELGNVVRTETKGVDPAKPNPGNPGTMTAKDLGLSAGQQDDLSTMATVQQQIQRFNDQFKSGNIPGVGAGFSGSLNELLARTGIAPAFGMNTTPGTQSRALVGQIRGTIAKLRGGTSFTDSEKEMLDSYTPTINDSDQVIRDKMMGLQQFVSDKRNATFQTALNPMSLDQIMYQGAPSQTQGGNQPDYRAKYGY